MAKSSDPNDQNKERMCKYHARADVQIDSGEGEQPMEGFYSERNREADHRLPDDDDVVLRYYNLLVFNFQTCEEFPFYLGILTEIQ